MYAELSPDNQDNSSVEKDLKDTVAQSRALPNGVEVEKAWATSIPQKPQTEERQPFILRPSIRLTSPGTARATTAPSQEHLNGTTEDGWADRHKEQIVI